MSIVIAVLDVINKSIHIAGDKRITFSKGETSSKYSDDFKKVAAIRDNLFLGVTGDADIGKSLSDFIIDNFKSISTDKLISELDKLEIELKKRDLQLILTGKNDSGDLFIWSRKFNTNSNLYLLKDNEFIFVISCNNDDAVRRLFKDLVYSTGDIPYAIHETIKEVSKTDISVSGNYDYFSCKI